MMGKGRLEAFSDGVLAIIITIMVLELKAPTSPDIQSLVLLGPVFAKCPPPDMASCCS